MTEKKPSLQTDIRKLFDEHEVLTYTGEDGLYELLGDRMADYNSPIEFKHRVRASVGTLKKKGFVKCIGRAKWKKA